MGKFFKLDEKIRNKVSERRQSIKFKALGMTGVTLETIYRIYFYAIDSFIKGKPNFWERQAFKLYVLNGIDTAYNTESKRRCKTILSTSKKGINEKDVLFLQNELRPYFVDSLKKQLKKSEDMLMPISNIEITRRIKLRAKEMKGEF